MTPAANNVYTGRHTSLRHKSSVNKVKLSVENAPSYYKLFPIKSITFFNAFKTLGIRFCEKDKKE